VVEEVIGTDASFGVTLGDIMFDDLSLFEELPGRSRCWASVVQRDRQPRHQLRREERQESDETFESFFGPSYYAFDYGPVHFLVLDDVEWYIVDGADGRAGTAAGSAKADGVHQATTWRLIPADQMVVLMMHIPLVDVRDRHELYRLIEKRPFCISISGTRISRAPLHHPRRRLAGA
jgi:hypothetical protein